MEQSVARFLMVADNLCRDDEQESQSKRSNVIAVCRPHKQYLLPLRVLPILFQISPHTNDDTTTAITC